MKKLSTLILSLCLIASVFLSACSLYTQQNPQEGTSAADPAAEQATTASAAENTAAESQEASEKNAEETAADGAEKTEIYKELDGKEAVQEVLPGEDGSYSFQGWKFADWQAFLKAQDKPVLLDFWATWCGPCMAASPTIDQIARAYKDKVRVFKINVDFAAEIVKDYQFDGIPAFFVINKGELQQSWLGAADSTFSGIQSELDKLTK